MTVSFDVCPFRWHSKICSTVRKLSNLKAQSLAPMPSINLSKGLHLYLFVREIVSLFQVTNIRALGQLCKNELEKKLNKLKQRLSEMKSLFQPCDTGLGCVFKSFSFKNSEQRTAVVWHVISSLPVSKQHLQGTHALQCDTSQQIMPKAQTSHSAIDSQKHRIS